jgi:hypothetical protein
MREERDLERALRRLDGVDAPDLWSRVGVSTPHRPIGPSPTRRVVVGISAVAVAAAVFLFLSTTFRAGPSPSPAAVARLPSDPCALLTPEQVSTATRSVVLSFGVVPDEGFIMPPEPPETNPCGYRTDGRFGEVIVTVNDHLQPYLDARDGDPRNTHLIEGLGDEAFRHGHDGSVWVRTANGYFAIGAQHGVGEEAASMLEGLARDALASLGATASPDTGATIDPDSICKVPPYDPSVALLGDESAGVFGQIGPRTFPLSVLDAAGERASSLTGTGADALRSYLASPEAVNAPSEGWRAIEETDSTLIFAAPPTTGYSDWWVVRFERADRVWRPKATELLNERRTPAQLGHGLALSWTGEVQLRDGTWTTQLVLANETGQRWMDEPEAGAMRAIAHVFDPATGQEIGRAATGVAYRGDSSNLPAGDTLSPPLALGGQLGTLDPGTYQLVACIPELGLASPAGTLRVVDDPSIAAPRLLTYPSTGGSMQALGGGLLVDHNGCVAVGEDANDPRPTYVLWPDGYALVERGATIVLIDALGTELAAMGEQIRLAGGYGGVSLTSSVIGGVPESCATGGHYFITGGPA